jgi:hypothetical protein
MSNLPVTFATLAAGDQPLSLLDQQFQAIGYLTVIPCQGSGQNTIILTPIQNSPAQIFYTNLSPIFTWSQSQTNTGATTIQIAGLAAQTAYKNNGQTAIGAGDLIAGNIYQAAWWGGIAGGAFIVNVVPTALTAPGAVQGVFQFLNINNVTTTTPAHQIIVSATSLSLFDGTNYSTAQSISSTVDASNPNGPNGLDTGSLVATTWYAIYAIQNTLSGATAGMLSTSFTSPSFTNAPGYAKYARVGSVLTNSTPAFVNFTQRGRRTQFTVGTYNGNALAALPTIASGSQGTINTTTFTPVSITTSAFLPTTASRIHFVLQEGGSTFVALAPNANYAGYQSATNPVPWIYVESGYPVTGEFELEPGGKVYYAGTNAACVAQCIGYEDNL